MALYVHVPFCVSLCPYCDFVVFAGASARGPGARIAAFTGALLAELSLRADVLDARFGRSRAPLRTVYIGGGTPTLLAAPAIRRILDLVRARFGVAGGAEVTIESNPGPDERGDARALADAGVTRLSLGAQALDAALLRRLGRRHAPIGRGRGGPGGPSGRDPVGLAGPAVRRARADHGGMVRGPGRRRLRSGSTTSPRTRSPSTIPTRKG